MMYACTSSKIQSNENMGWESDCMPQIITLFEDKEDAIFSLFLEYVIIK